MWAFAVVLFVTTQGRTPFAVEDLQDANFHQYAVALNNACATLALAQLFSDILQVRLRKPHNILHYQRKSLY